MGSGIPFTHAFKPLGTDRGQPLDQCVMMHCDLRLSVGPPTRLSVPPSLTELFPETVVAVTVTVTDKGVSWSLLPACCPG